MMQRTYSAGMSVGFGGFWDSIGDILPQITTAAGNIVQIFKPQPKAYPGSAPAQYPPSYSQAGSLETYLPLILIGGLAILLINRK